MFHRQIQLRLLACPVLTLAVLTAGCGDAGRYKIVPVSGKIAYADGRTLPPGTGLRFDPAEGGMRTASGVTGGDGSFTIQHASGTAGAEVGKYTVVLIAPKDRPVEFFRSVPRDYYEGSGAFFVEVKEGMPPLELKVPVFRR
jgi:hypothetical protein